MSLNTVFSAWLRATMGCYGNSGAIHARPSLPMTTWFSTIRECSFSPCAPRTIWALVCYPIATRLWMRA